MNASISLFHILIVLPGAEAFDSVPEDEKEWWMGKSGLPSICALTVEELSTLATDSFIRYPVRWAYLKQHVIGGGLSKEFRLIARRVYTIHLRKYLLGNLERVSLFRVIIRGLKKVAGR